MAMSQLQRAIRLSIWTFKVNKVILFYCFHILTVVLYVYAVGLYEMQRIK
jgi:hypothetical protein